MRWTVHVPRWIPRAPTWRRHRPRWTPPGWAFATAGSSHPSPASWPGATCCRARR
jgi:hypothetical protein